MSIPPSTSATAIVSVSVINTGKVACDRNQIVKDAPSSKIDIPVLAFLIEKDGKAYTFDLGLRPDLDAVPKHVQDLEYYEFPPTASDTTIPAILPADVDIDTIFPSHYHWDHVGNPGLLPKDTRLVFGTGSLAKIGSGYPDGDPWFDAKWLHHCRFTETDFDSGPIGDFPKGKDWFGDGSLWLIDCPGHCDGNIHDIASFGTHLGETVTLHENHEEAKANFQRLFLMSLRENVMVILAHERQALGVLPMLNKAGENRGVLSRWSTEGWKEAKLSKARA